jgi:UDP-N-acetylglucosamine/UDP-N-acetylgalactosamine diphosphorylase
MQDHLKKFGQEHVLQFWDDLNIEERKKLCTEITQTDFAELKKYYERTQEANKEEVKLLDTLMEPVPSDKTGSYVNSSKEQLENYENIGK